MAKQDAAKGEKNPDPEKVRTESVKLNVVTVAMLRDIADARGWHLWRVVDDLLAAELPAVHAAVQPKLRQIRTLQAQAAESPRAARKAPAG